MGIIIGGTVTAVTFINRGFRHLDKRVTEKSVGATAVMGLMEADLSVRKDFEELKSDQQDLHKTVDKLELHYDAVVARAMEILTR